MMKKGNRGKRNVQFLAAAALTAALIAGQIQPLPVHGSSAQIQVGSLIPDNVTIDQPVPLSEISLPGSDYGTLSWVDDSSVPSERVQSYEVVFHPYNSSDLAKIAGWDGVSDAIYSSVTVVVSNPESSQESESDNQESSEDEEEWTEDADGGYTDSEDGYYEESGDTGEDYDKSGEADGGSEENQGTADGTQESTGEDAEQEITEDSVEAEPEVTAVPEEKPEITEQPDDAEEGTETEETPEATLTPEITVTPQITVTPVITETPEKDEPEVTQEPEVTATPEVSVTPEPTVTVEEDENIFDRDEEGEKDTRPDEFGDNLTDEEKEAIAEENHSCNGISVSGISLPWYVQFQVSSGDDYEFTNESEANIFKSYEFQLWDLKNDTEYHVPDGEYISVTVPVKAGYDYTIEHLLDNGAMETIVPSVDGSTMVFSTHSFSPFGIAGSKPLVGEEIAEDGYEDTTANQTTVTPAASSSSGTNENGSSVTAVPESSDSNGSSQSGSTQTKTEQKDTADAADTGDSAETVNTGDNTPIAPFVILAVAAVVIIGVIVYLRKRK